MPEDQDSQLLSIKNATKKNAKGYLTYRTGTKPFVLPNYLIIPRQHYAGIVFWENASLFQALVVEDERKNAFFRSSSSPTTEGLEQARLFLPDWVRDTRRRGMSMQDTLRSRNSVALATPRSSVVEPGLPEGTT